MTTQTRFSTFKPEMIGKVVTLTVHHDLHLVYQVTAVLDSYGIVDGKLYAGMKNVSAREPLTKDGQTLIIEFHGGE